VITQVRLKNWKSHRDTDLRLGDGTNVLVGSMGSGKSAVLDAITFALFGTLPVVKARLAKLDDLITNRPRPMGSAEIEVQFIAPDGEEYVVKRVIERGKGTTLSELRKSSGELIESPSSTRVSEVIQSILKLDYDLFERAIYSEQNRLDYFLVLPRGKRMESIDELLRIDKLELARKNMTTLINRARGRIDDLRAMVAQLGQDATLMALPALEGELKGVELSIRETASKLQLVQPELDAVRAELGRMKEVEQKILQLDKSISGLEGDIGAIGRQIDQIKGRLGEAAGLKLEELEHQVGELQQTYGRVSAGMEEVSARLTANTSLAAELAARVAMLRERLEKLSVDVERKRGARGQLEQLKPKELSELAERLQSDHRKVSDELAACNTRARDIKRALSELAVAGPVCPVCESPLSEEKKQALLREREKQLEVYSARLSELGFELGRLDGDLRGTLELLDRAKMLAKEVEDLPKLEGESSQLIAQIGELDAKLAETRSTVEKLRSDTERSRAEVETARERLLAIQQALQLKRDLDRLELERRQKQAEGLKAQRELWQLRRTYDESRVRELEKRQEELVREHGRLSADLAGKEQVLVERKRLVDALREKRAMLERGEVQVKYIQQAVDALGTIQAALAQTQLTLRRDFIEGVNGAMQELWREVYPYGDLTSIRLDVREGDYVLQVCDRLGNWIPVEGMASGGERTDACLALRMAFAMVLAPALSWLVLDEPTHNLDEEGIRELASVLRERIPEVVRQVLLITHEERLEAAVSGYLYRFYRDKDADLPTKVEQVTLPESIKKF